MKALPRIFGLTFLSLILTNCSLSSEQIASRLERSIVKVFYRSQPGHGTGFFVRGEPGVCTVLTAAHVVKKEGERLLQTEDGEVWDAARVEIFSNGVDLALVTFRPERGNCNYRALKIGNSDSLRKGSSIYIDGFPIRGGIVVSQFVEGKVSGLNTLARGYGVSYEALTMGGMSGAPVMNERGEVVAVHGMSDFDVVQTFASLPLSESERQTFQQALERVNGVQRLTFSWGVPINWFRESDFYYGDISQLSLWVLFCGGAIFGGGIVYFGLRYFQTPQVVAQGRARELERRLENEQLGRREVERRLSSVQNAQRELERQLENERRKRQEVEAQRQLENEGRKRQEAEAQRQLENERRKRQEAEAQRQRVVESQQAKPLSSVDVPLVSAKGVDYTKLRDLLAAGKWKEADDETARVMLKVAGRESEGWLDVEHIENFPCQDLGTIDKLWVKYSNGKFGFSVQKQIYQSLGAKEYSREVWEAFGDKVGWRQKGKWSYQNVTWDMSTPYVGHLPFLFRPGNERPTTDEVARHLPFYFALFRERIVSSLAQRLVDCSI